LLGRRLHITYGLLQTVYHTVYTSPTACSKQYITPSTHHLELVPNSIPHSLHITYSLFQTVYHTVYTSPTACTNQYTTPSTHHLELSKQYPTPSTHHLQLVPINKPHYQHITYSLFQPVYHTFYISPSSCSNKYTTPSEQQLELLPNSIPHCVHIT